MEKIMVIIERVPVKNLDGNF